MGNVINLKRESKKSTLLDTILHGTPCELTLFGKTFQMMSVPYMIKKRKEFFEVYWHHFTDEISHINDKEFDALYVAERFKALSDAQKTKVLWECSEIYAFNDKLTYECFINVIDSYSLRKI
jgi:hypothetical protein